MKLKFEKNNKSHKTLGANGFTLIEILVAIFVFSLIIGLVAGFQSDVFSLNRVIQVGLANQSEAKKLVRPFTNEVRSAEPSNLGAYPIAEATASSFTFYSDTDGDGLRERIRYFMDGSDFKKGTTKPSGTPLVYDSSDEKIIKVIHDVLPGGIFTYFGSDYDGTPEAQVAPLVEPIQPSDIRLVRVVLQIDSDPNAPPAPLEITTQVSIRNLKDNL